jgi:hypothetical protein
MASKLPRKNPIHGVVAALTEMDAVESRRILKTRRTPTGLKTDPSPLL